MFQCHVTFKMKATRYIRTLGKTIRCNRGSAALRSITPESSLQQAQTFHTSYAPARVGAKFHIPTTEGSLNLSQNRQPNKSVPFFEGEKINTTISAIKIAVLKTGPYTL
jgi:hypothetical protein